MGRGVILDQPDRTGLRHHGLQANLASTFSGMALVLAILKGSWDLVTRVLIMVSVRITTYNPQLRYFEPYLLSRMIFHYRTLIEPFH